LGRTVVERMEATQDMANHQTQHDQNSTARRKDLVTLSETEGRIALILVDG
jgi:hypothetical protein